MARGEKGLDIAVILYGDPEQQAHLTARLVAKGYAAVIVPFADEGCGLSEEAARENWKKVIDQARYVVATDDELAEEQMQYARDRDRLIIRIKEPVQSVPEIIPLVVTAE